MKRAITEIRDGSPFYIFNRIFKYRIEGKKSLEQESMKQQLQKIKDRSKVDIAVKVRDRRLSNNIFRKIY